MYAQSDDGPSEHKVIVTEEVKAFIKKRKADFRVCTSCGGPILLPVSIKPPKSTDTEIYIGDRIIYISIYQVRFLDRIDMSMIPHFCMYG
jgi:hypothetical protein